MRLLRHEHRRHNTLACTKGMDEIKDTIKVYPLPHMAVVKDLVPDMTNFYAQYASIEPWLQTKSPRAGKGMEAEPRGPTEARRPLRVHPVRLLLDILPKLLVEFGSLSRPAALLQANRWINDSRDEATGERLDNLEDPFRFVPLPHHHELHQGLPEGPQSGEVDRRDQEEDGRAAGVIAAVNRPAAALQFRNSRLRTISSRFSTACRAVRSRARSRRDRRLTSTVLATGLPCLMSSTC